MHPRLSALLLLLALGCAAPSGGGGDPGAVRDNVSAAGLALEGYDPVAYFPEGGGEPRAGDPAITAEHAGHTYRFASEANRARFLADPGRYVPAYGGWCAYAMADGEEVEVDPESFLIQDGELLLFYDGLFNDTRAKWSQRPEELKRAADSHWKQKTMPAAAEDGAGSGTSRRSS